MWFAIISGFLIPKWHRPVPFKLEEGNITKYTSRYFQIHLSIIWFTYTYNLYFLLETEKQLDEVIQKMAFDVGGENLLIVTQYPNSTFRSVHYNISARTAEIAEHSTTPSCDQVLNLIHNSLYCCHYAVPGHCTVYGYIIDLQFSDLLGESTPEVENGIFDWVIKW